jgi:hypothetical protein
MDKVILTLLFTLAPLTAVAENQKSVFIHAACDGKSSSAALASLRQVIRTSQKYQLVHTLDDDGRMGIVLSIYMSCAERNDVIAVATSYGLAKCYGEKNCHLSVDGHSIKSTLCDARSAAECGQMLFQSFDDYMKSPNSSTFKLN